jgi:hypothetical protein
MVGIVNAPKVKRLRRIQTAFAGAVVFATWGCAHVATVKTTEPRVPTIASREDELTLAKQHLIAATLDRSLTSASATDGDSEVFQASSR